MTDEMPGPFFLVQEADAVDPRCCRARAVRDPSDGPTRPEASHSAFGRNHSRPENESSGPKSKSHRFSSGSRPLKTDASSTTRPMIDGGRDHAERDVRGVERVMAERRRRIVAPPRRDA